MKHPPCLLQMRVAAEMTGIVRTADELADGSCVLHLGASASSICRRPIYATA